MSGLLIVKWKLLGCAFADRRLTRADMGALFAVVDRVNSGTRVAWPSLAKIARDVNLSRRQAIRSVNKVVRLGYLHRVAGNRHRSNMYSMGNPAEQCSGAPVTKLVTSVSPKVVTAGPPESIDLNLSNESTKWKARAIGDGVRQILSKGKSSSSKSKASREEIFAALNASKDRILKNVS